MTDRLTYKRYTDDEVADSFKWHRDWNHQWGSAYRIFLNEREVGYVLHTNQTNGWVAALNRAFGTTSTLTPTRKESAESLVKKAFQAVV